MVAFIASAFAAMSMAGGIAPTRDGRSQPSPIRLAVEQGEHGALLQVTGLTDTACNATYALEVSGGGNRSTQRGSVRLQPNVAVTLVNLNLASPHGHGWSAKLSVTSCNGEKYEQYGSSS